VYVCIQVFAFWYVSLNISPSIYRALDGFIWFNWRRLAAAFVIFLCLYRRSQRPAITVRDGCDVRPIWMARYGGGGGVGGGDERPPCGSGAPELVRRPVAQTR
jgi:hypothetical protein